MNYRMVGDFRGYKFHELEVLGCTGEPGNRRDSYAVAVYKDSVIVGHLPWKNARCFSIFFAKRWNNKL